MNRWRSIAFGAILLMGASPGHYKAGIDHILVGVPSLDAGVAAFEKATGVSPVRGGHHPSRGTENALVSLGDGVYLELIAPQADAADSELVKALRGLQKPSVIGWAVHVDDAGGAIERLRRHGFISSPAQPGSRITPAGEKLEWTTFEIEKPRIESMPFFIQWSAATRHPSTTSPRCTLAAFHVEDPQASELVKALGALNVTADIRAAKKPRMQLDVRCGARTISFTNP